MPPPDPTPTDLAELERFVVENDDLLALEERIGRFNIFDALGIVRAEIRHSNFLAWLLDPSESHGHGDLFLKSVLMDLFKAARRGGYGVPISPVELDGGDLESAEVRREWNRIDLLVVDPGRQLVVAIENKIDSGEHSDQLNRYEHVLDREFGGWKRLLVYLTPSGYESSDEDWVPYSYADLKTVLQRVKKSSAGALGSDVAAFIEHYLNLIETRLMDDKEIARLCRNIYANHKRAIDLVVQHMPQQGLEEIGILRDYLEREPGRWIVRNANKNMIFFQPRSWAGKLCDGAGVCLPDVACDVYLEAEVWLARACNLSARLVVGVGADPARRLSVIEALNREPFSLGMQRKTASGRWTRLGSKTLLRWDHESTPERKAVEDAFAGYLSELDSKLGDIPAVVLAK